MRVPKGADARSVIDRAPRMPRGTGAGSRVRDAAAASSRKECVFMKSFNVVAKLPEVSALVVSDTSGTLRESSGTIDAEAAGAIHAFAFQTLGQLGDLLGLGTLHQASVTGPSKACLIVGHNGEVIGVYVDPNKPLSAIEKKLLDSLQR
jgi:predicted regulator of Ras-like GTPase activity (Roadblock/LC7/MglB family)